MGGGGAQGAAAVRAHVRSLAEGAPPVPPARVSWLGGGLYHVTFQLDTVHTAVRPLP